MVSFAAAIVIFVLVTINCCIPLGPRTVLEGVTSNAGAVPVVIVTVGVGNAVFVP